MAVLLDTHTFLWWCEDDPQLSRKARKTVTNEDCFVSCVGFWEIAIKVSLGKLRLPGIFDRFLAEQMSLNGFEQLKISFRQIARCASLPFHHRDPFDRLLVAQAQEEKLAILSHDERLSLYAIKRIW